VEGNRETITERFERDARLILALNNSCFRGGIRGIDMVSVERDFFMAQTEINPMTPAPSCEDGHRSLRQTHGGAGVLFWGML
jgi:hypothetical protein